jgi:hypothetical protein
MPILKGEVVVSESFVVVCDLCGVGLPAEASVEAAEAAAVGFKKVVSEGSADKWVCPDCVAKVVAY